MNEKLFNAYQYFFVIIIAFGTINAQIIFKKGLILLGGIAFSTGVMVKILGLMHSPYVLGAFFLHGIIFLFWVYVLSRTQLIYLFTMTGAFFYILLALKSWIVLGEKLSLIHWLGITMISFGVVCFNYQAL